MRKRCLLLVLSLLILLLPLAPAAQGQMLFCFAMCKFKTKPNGQSWTFCGGSNRCCWISENACGDAHWCSECYTPLTNPAGF